MKYLFLSIILISSICVSAQTQTPPAPKFKPYVSVSTGISSARGIGFSAEAGAWGMSSPLSISLDFDFNYDRNLKTPSHYSGPKLYYTVTQNDKLSIMVYASVKILLDRDSTKTHDTIIEDGASLNLNLSKSTMFTITYYLQSVGNSPLQSNLSLGIVQLF